MVKINSRQLYKLPAVKNGGI